MYRMRIIKRKTRMATPATPPTTPPTTAGVETFELELLSLLEVAVSVGELPISVPPPTITPPVALVEDDNRAVVVSVADHELVS